MTKGFITVAAGEYYCKLATHLYMSYKLFGNCDYPFYVITDEIGAEKLKDVFDGVIVKSDFTNTSFDKICIFTLTPFDKTVFIDADCSIVRDIKFAFDEFEKNGFPISAISGVKDVGEKGIQFGKAAIEAFNIKRDFPGFNGGVYYYEKSPNGQKCVDFMLNELVPKYHQYELMGRGNKINMGDEPIVIVGMLKFGFDPLPIESGIMVLVQYPKKVKWNIKKRKCSFKWYEFTVSPAIIHWKVGGTETLRFEKYDATVKGLYYKYGFLRVLKDKLKASIKYRVYPILLKIFPGIRKIMRKEKGQ